MLLVALLNVQVLSAISVLYTNCRNDDNVVIIPTVCYSVKIYFETNSTQNVLSARTLPSFERTVMCTKCVWPSFIKSLMFVKRMMYEFSIAPVTGKLDNVTPLKLDEVNIEVPPVYSEISQGCSEWFQEFDVNFESL